MSMNVAFMYFLEFLFFVECIKLTTDLSVLFLERDGIPSGLHATLYKQRYDMIQRVFNDRLPCNTNNLFSPI